MGPQKGKEMETAPWFLDSGAVVNCTFDRKLLSDLHLLEEPYKRLRFANGEESLIYVRGLVQTERFKLPDVYFVPGMRMNVVSVSVLVSYGYEVVFYQHTCVVKDAITGRVVGQARQRHGSLVLDYLTILDQGEKWAHDEVWDNRLGLVLPKSSCWGRPILPKDSTLSARQANFEKWLDTNVPTWRSDIASGFRIQVKVAQGDAYCHLASATYDKNVFVMDSGAGSHMTPDMDVLKAYIGRDDPMFPTVFLQMDVIFGNGERLQVCGIGYIDTGDISLDDVLHVPGMAANLVSVAVLIDQLTTQLVDRLGKGAAQLQPVEVSFRQNHVAHIVGRNAVGYGPRVGNIYHVRKLQARWC